MKTYTRTGDDGTTGLFGGERTSKDDVRVEAYGTVDELNAALGVAQAAAPSSDCAALLVRIQSDLFALGAELACSPARRDRLPAKPLDADDIKRLEDAIDEAEAILPPLKNFVLPGGTPAAAALHAARTVCRRAERRLVTLRRSGEIRNEDVIYLNRLGDLLFVLARRANQDAGVADAPWLPNKG